MLSLSLKRWSYLCPVSISWVSYLKSRLHLENRKTGASRLNLADFSAGLSRQASLTALTSKNTSISTSVLASLPS